MTKAIKEYLGKEKKMPKDIKTIDRRTITKLVCLMLNVPEEDHEYDEVTEPYIQTIEELIRQAKIKTIQELVQEIGPARDKETWEDWAWRTHKAMKDKIEELNREREEK